MTENEMVGWHHQLNGHGFEQAPGDGDGQGSLECCSPWGCKELNTTELLNNKNLQHLSHVSKPSPQAPTLLEPSSIPPAKSNFLFILVE